MAPRWRYFPCMTQKLHVVGGGLAGSEAAWAAANMGVPVVLHEMRPVRGTDAHKTDGLAELVCSNSFRSDDATIQRRRRAARRDAACRFADHGQGRRQPGAGRRRAGGRPRRLFGGRDRGTGSPSADRDRARGSRRPAARRVGAGHRRHRTADLAGAGRSDREPDRAGIAVLLRCHRADRPLRFDRPGQGLVPVPLRQGRPRRHRQGLHQLPDGPGRSTRPSSMRCWPATRPASRSGRTSPISTAACRSR